MPAPLEPEDLYRFRWLAHPRVSPDGSLVVFATWWGDAAARANRGRIAVVPAGGGVARDLTGGDSYDHSPEWSPDGSRIAFMRRVRGVDQVHVVAAAGGAPMQVTDIEGGAAHPRWSPDGTEIALLARVISDPAGVVDDPRPPAGEEARRRPPVARIADRLDYKADSGGYADGRHWQLAVCAAAEGAELAMLTRGPGDVSAFDWSPRGDELVVVAAPDPDGDRRITGHVIAVARDGTQRRLVSHAIVEAVAWSPRSDLVAYVGPAGLEAGLIPRLWVVPAEGGEPRCLTLELDASVSNTVINDMRAGHDVPLVWSGDGAGVTLLCTRAGACGLVTVRLDGGIAHAAGGLHDVYDFDARAGKTVVAVAGAADPGNLALLEDGLRPLTDLNPWLRERWLSEPRRRTYRAPDGLELEGWLYPTPAGCSTSTPLVLQVHGGPHALYGWSFFHEFQVLAGRGIAVLAVNPRGSDGYGEAFRRAVVRDWAGKDYEDLMAALDQELAAGSGDPARLGIAGGSYGGYMTNWAIGHSKRFKAAVSMRSISNLVSEYAQHDIVPWGTLELGEPPWPDPDELWRRSPIRYVRDIETPLLLTHGEMDLRCAISQAEELFGAMRLLGKTVRMARFPGENHDLSRSGRPDRRVERLRLIAEWLETYLE